MARARIISKARQRYEMVPVLDEDGKQKEVPVTRADGTPKMTRRGSQPIMRKLTMPDKTRPLPPRQCERCGAELSIGKPFRVISIKRQVGGTDRFRCMSCPIWQPWEVSNSLSARVQQIQAADFDVSEVEDESGAQDAATVLADQIRELAEEKAESAQNMEDGFGHATSASDEIREQAEQLESWAGEMEGLSFEDPPDTDCTECEGQGKIIDPGEPDDPTDCSACNGTGEREVPDEEWDEWRESVRQVIQDALDNCPI
jgi:hypothetical protein